MVAGFPAVWRLFLVLERRVGVVGRLLDSGALVGGEDGGSCC